MTPKVISACAVMLLSSIAAAQEAGIVGKWSGNYTSTTTSGSSMAQRITLDIKSVEGEKVQGVGSVHTTSSRGGNCSGDYPVEGTFKGNALRVRSTEKGGRGGDCSFSLNGTLQGDKLLAKRGQNDFEMTK